MGRKKLPRDENGKILHERIIGYDPIKKQPIKVLITDKEYKIFFKGQRKMEAEEKHYRRQQKRVTNIDMDKLPDKISGSSFNSPLKEETERKLKRWIYDLPQPQRKIGIAVFLNHKKMMDVSKEMGIPYSTVRYMVKKMISDFGRKSKRVRERMNSKATYMADYRRKKKGAKEK